MTGRSLGKETIKCIFYRSESVQLRTFWGTTLNIAENFPETSIDVNILISLIHGQLN